MVMIVFLYVPILLSLSLTFLFHAFRKHIHSFFYLIATNFNTTDAIDNYKLHLKCHHPNSVGFINDTNKGVEGLMNLNFKSTNERQVSDEIDNNNDKDEGENDCWRMMKMVEERDTWRNVKTFPPPLSSLNKNGQPNFTLLPVRKNARLQLQKVRIKRPNVLNAMRQDGRLRLFLVPDQCIPNDDYDDEEEKEEENQNLLQEQMEEKEIIVESMELEKNDNDGVEEIIRCKQEDIRVREWEFPNERYSRCHEMMNHIHSSHHNLHMYGVGFA